MHCFEIDADSRGSNFQLLMPERLSAMALPGGGSASG